MKTRMQLKKGFTLVEVMVASTISLFILASSYATVMSLAKGSKSMINFSEMNSQTRFTVDQFGRDARMAEDVETWTDTTFTCLNSTWNPSTKTYRDYRVTYEYFPVAGTFKRTVVDTNGTPHNWDDFEVENRILLYDVQDLNFTYYSLINQDEPLQSREAETRLEIKHVQIEAELQRKVLSLTNTNYIISARFMLRNKNKK